MYIPLKVLNNIWEHYWLVKLLVVLKIVVFQQILTLLLLKSQEVLHSRMLILLLVGFKRRGHPLRIIILDLWINLLIIGQAHGLLLDSYNFAKKHCKNDAFSSRYGGSCSLGVKYTNYLKNNPGSTLSKSMKKWVQGTVGLSINQVVHQSNTQIQRSIRRKVPLCGRIWCFHTMNLIRNRKQ